MSKKLFTPGPTNIPEFTRIQLSKDIIHHRMSDYQKILYRVTDKLKDVFQTKEDVYILTSSGTGAMESAIVNLFSYEDEILVINTGNFGDRFVEIGEIFKLKVHQLKYEWGTTYDLAEVKDYLKKNKQIKGVFVTYHETSTGVLNDIQALGELLKDENILLIADCISGMVVHDFRFDEWHIDCALASSQKGFLLPPGIAFVSLSSKAKLAMKQSNLPKFYWDYQKYSEYYKKGQNPYTPAISLILALDIALNTILEKSISKIEEEKRMLRHYTEMKLNELGFESFIKDESIKGNVLVPVLVNELVDTSKLVDYLDKRHNLSVSKGQGKFTEIMLRVGIISEFTTDDIDELMMRIKEFIELGDN